jgi:ABC-type branched-subunit amino acid transport system ATPase component
MAAAITKISEPQTAIMPPNPAFIMFDEPSLGLSPLMVEFVFNVILELKKSGMTSASFVCRHHELTGCPRK